MSGPGEVASDRGAWVRLLLLVASAALLITDMALIFLWVPTDVVLGVVQRIFYFHVPAALIGFVGFFIVFIASIGYLAKGTREWDRVAHSAAEIGVVFLTVALITGSIWARPVWGTWWTWDPKLTASFVLWVIYVGYLMVRAYAPSRVQAARYSAVVGIIGFVDVPIVYLAAEWWRTLHPSAVAGPLAQADSLERSMYYVFLLSLLAFGVLFTYLLLQRVDQRRDEDTVSQLSMAGARPEAETGRV